MGRAIEPRKQSNRVPTLLANGEGNIRCGDKIASLTGTRRGRRPWHVEKQHAREPGDLQRACRTTTMRSVTARLLRRVISPRLCAAFRRNSTRTTGLSKPEPVGVMMGGAIWTAIWQTKPSSSTRKTGRSRLAPTRIPVSPRLAEVVGRGGGRGGQPDLAEVVGRGGQPDLSPSQFPRSGRSAPSPSLLSPRPRGCKLKSPSPPPPVKALFQLFHELLFAKRPARVSATP